MKTRGSHSSGSVWRKQDPRCGKGLSQLLLKPQSTAFCVAWISLCCHLPPRALIQPHVAGTLRTALVVFFIASPHITYWVSTGSWMVLITKDTIIFGAQQRNTSMKELAESVKHLLSKHKNLSCFCRIHIKKWGMMAHACNSSRRNRESRRHVSSHQ